MSEEKTNPPRPIRRTCNLEDCRPPPVQHLPTTYRLPAEHNEKAFTFSPAAIAKSNKAGSPYHSYVDALKPPYQSRPSFCVRTPKTPIYYIDNSPKAKRKAWWLEESKSADMSPSKGSTPK